MKKLLFVLLLCAASAASAQNPSRVYAIDSMLRSPVDVAKRIDMGLYGKYGHCYVNRYTSTNNVMSIRLTGLAFGTLRAEMIFDFDSTSDYLFDETLRFLSFTTDDVSQTILPFLTSKYGAHDSVAESTNIGYGGSEEKRVSFIWHPSALTDGCYIFFEFFTPDEYIDISRVAAWRLER